MSDFCMIAMSLFMISLLNLLLKPNTKPLKNKPKITNKIVQSRLPNQPETIDYVFGR